MSSTNPPPPLPPPFLLADDPALDFLNSVATPGEQTLDWLAGGAGLLGWLGAAGLVPPEALAPFHANPSALDTTASEARARREWLRGIVAAYAGAPLTASALDALAPLNGWLSADDSRLQLVATGGLVALRREVSWQTPDSLLLPVAQSMAALLCGSGLTSVRHCEGAGCSLWFRDISARQTRRWCSMALCGNRAKAAAHRARLRGQGAL